MDEEEIKLLEEAKKIIISNKNVPGGMDIVRKTMNIVYRYFKGVIQDASLEDKRIFEVFKLELLLENEFLPFSSKPIFDVECPPVLPDIICNEEDFLKTMDFVVHKD